MAMAAAFGAPTRGPPAARRTGHARRAPKAVAALRVPVACPIGVPRVPFRTPKENLWTWVDIWNCLYRERIIFVGQGITDEFANQLVGTMLFLDSENNKDITLYVNCKGGDIVPTLAIHDAMKHLGSDVGTIAFGGAFGMGGFLLASGTKGKRMALPNTQIMLNSPSGTARGQASDIQNEAKELIRVRAYIAERIGECTGRSMEETIVDFQRDRYFTPETALDYGIIDRVVQPNKAYNEEYMAEVAKKKAAQVAARAEAAKKKKQEQEQAPPSSGETPPPAPA